MDENERLEPVLNEDQTRIKSVHKLLNPKPNMSMNSLGNSDILNKVRNFLPQMAEAEMELNTALRNGQGDQLNIENVDDDDKVIEMDVALVKENSEQPWTSDSEPDSTPSQTDNNDYTSDSDISSSSTCSSSTCSDKETKKSSKNTSRNKSEKRPMIEVLESPEEPSSKILKSNGDHSNSSASSHNKSSSSHSRHNGASSHSRHNGASEAKAPHVLHNNLDDDSSSP